MKEFKTDILIIGGGLTGLLSAFAMSFLHKNIIIIDKSPLFLKNDNSSDLRTTAISESSKVFFENINFWSKIQKSAEPIKYIKVFDRNNHKGINFYNNNKQKNLGYIVKNSIIKNTLIKNLNKTRNVKLIANQNLINLIYKQDEVIAVFGDLKIKSKLVIAADGKKSSVREIVKTPIYKKIYNHEAMIINCEHKKNHNNIAHELFFKTGPLAILPMVKSTNSLFSSSIIWSNPISYSKNLRLIKKELLKKILEEKTIKYTGQIKKIIDIQFFPLSAHINYKFFEKNLVYVGDAAHSIHPIAGQGWNLGIRDIKKLHSELKKNIELGLEISDINVLKRYHDQSFYDSYSLYQITDKLNSVFINDAFLINQIRKFGFNLIEKNHNIKKNITNFAMGF